MIYISYKIKKWANDGTFYNQSIRATQKDAEKIAKLLQKEYEKAKEYKKQRTITNEQMKKICYQKPLAETETEIDKTKVFYFLNLTQLKTIKTAYSQNKRILNKNTILIFDCEGV